VTTPAEQPGLLDKADRLGRFVENISLVLVLSAMIILAAAQIVMRNMFETGLSWGDEALRIMVLWIAMLGAVAATRERRHIVIDVLSRMLPDNFKLWAAFVVDSFSAVVTGALAWYAAEFVIDSKQYGDLLLNDLPAWLFQLILPISFAIISYRFGIWSLRHLRNIFQGINQS
jgi:TRAP-type C4-dicarboxylate transport system permease small subunit